MSEGIAFVFPGQGSQFVGMGKDVLNEGTEGFFVRARQALGFDLAALMFHGPAERLTLTANAQPAILLDSAVKDHLLKRRGLVPRVAAGHSLGEYSALVSAGALTLEDALVLVHKRGQYMQEASPPGKGAMVAVLKLDAEPLRRICEETAGQVQVANYNCPGQIVISGEREAVLEAARRAQAAGARTVELDVSAPFHSPLMGPAQERLREDLAKVRFQRPAYPVISTVSGRPETDPQRIQALLMEQITAPVRWADYVEALAREGITTLIEVGPGEVLTRLNRRILRRLISKSYGEVVGGGPGL